MSLLSTAVSLLWLIPCLNRSVLSQTTQTVTVGLRGSFFDPPYVLAAANSTVRFIFQGVNHTVTQGTFESPCLPLPGGFNSGPAGKGLNESNPAPIWDLIITNDLQPIWYFCEVTNPNSHCASGMTGAINPPNISMVAQFSNSAKLVTATPAPSPAVTLKGVGASATNSPAPPSSQTDTSTSTSLFASSTLAPPSATNTLDPPTTETSASMSSFDANKAGNIAGIVIGAVALIIVLVLLYLFLKRRKNKGATNTLFSNVSPPQPNMSNLSGSRGVTPFIDYRYDVAGAPTQPDNRVFPVIPTGRPSNSNLAGFTRAGDIYGNARLENHDVYDVSTATEGTSSQDKAREETRRGAYKKPNATTGSPDINLLAREVAAVLQQHSASPSPRVDHFRTGENESNDGGVEQGHRPQLGSPAPPLYRT